MTYKLLFCHSRSSHYHVIVDQLLYLVWYPASKTQDCHYQSIVPTTNIWHCELEMNKNNWLVLLCNIVLQF